MNHFEGTFPEEMTKFYVENGLYKPLGEQPSLGFDGGQIRYKTGTAERESLVALKLIYRVSQKKRSFVFKGF